VPFLWNAYGHSDVIPDAYSYSHSYSAAKSYTDSYGATESYTDSHSYGTTKSHSDSNSYGDSHDHAKCYGDGDSHSYREADAHCPACNDTKATSNASAATGRKGTELIIGVWVWGAHASRVLVSVSTPKQSLQKFKHLICSEHTQKVRDGEDAIASTRDACATQERGHSQSEATSLD
jgi:hypothetical protein